MTPRTNRFLRATGKTTLPTASKPEGHPKQTAFLLLPHLEALYGGAAGGGKSVALLIAALQYVDVPGYAAILLRKTYRDLALPGALMDMSHQWLQPLAENGMCKWSAAEHRWKFHGGGSLSFGYLEGPNDKYRYQSAEFQFVGFDELTQFEELDYRYLFSRLRKSDAVSESVPLRFRSASNPGGRGHEWVKQRFVTEGREAGRVFLPARVEDNPYLDLEEYERSLNELDPLTRAQLRAGDWEARNIGIHFQRQWFEIVDTAPVEARRVRYWDLAATAPKANRDPDYTVGLKMSMDTRNICYVEDLRRARISPMSVEAQVRQDAELDGKDVRICIEREPGASGKALADHYRRNVLIGYPFSEDKVSGDKVSRAAPVSSASEGGNVKLVRGPWIGPFLDELEAFPEGAHDDQVDAFGGAFNFLAQGVLQHVKTGW